MTSWRARVLIARLWLQRNKRFYANPTVMRTRLANHQSPRRARPPRWMRHRFRIVEHTVDGHQCYTLSPLDQQGIGSRWHVFHLHGGGFVEAPEPHHWRFAARLIDRLGCTYSVPMYPLTPAHDHRTIVAMIEHAYDTVLAGTPDSDRMVFGDSAGGTLALTLTRHLREQARPQPAGLALFSPWIDLATDDPLSLAIDPRDPELGVTGLRQAARWYANGRALDDPEISPAFGDLTASPPIIVFSGDRDILLPDARRIKELGHSAGARVELHEYPGMFHNWIMKSIPEADTATDELMAFLHSIDKMSDSAPA